MATLFTQPTELLGLGNRGLLPQAPLILPINLNYLDLIPAIEELSA